MGRPTASEDNELSKITKSVPQNQLIKTFKSAMNPAGIESQLELLRKETHR